MARNLLLRLGHQTPVLYSSSNAVLVPTHWSHRDLQAHRLPDSSAASHGACKPSSELRLSEEPGSADVEGGGYA